MPNRLVNTELWNDETIIENFTAEDKYFWLYLLTSPHNNMCGVFKNSPALIARDMGLGKDTVINLIYRFETYHKMIYCDKDTNEILILKWYKYNWNKSTKILNLIEKEQQTIKSSELNHLIEQRKNAVFLDEKQYPIDTLSIPYRYPPISNTNTNTNADIYDNYNFSDKVKKHIDLWLSYKKERKQSYKDTGLKVLLNNIQKQINEFGENYVCESIDFSIANNYQGIYAQSKLQFQKVYNNPTKTRNERTYTKEELDAMIQNANDIEF